MGVETEDENPPHDHPWPPYMYAHLSAVVEKLTKTLEELPNRVAEIYVRKDVYQAEQKAQDREIDNLNTMKDWVIRIVLGAVLLALLGLVITQTGVG